MRNSVADEMTLKTAYASRIMKRDFLCQSSPTSVLQMSTGFLYGVLPSLLDASYAAYLLIQLERTRVISLPYYIHACPIKLD